MTQVVQWALRVTALVNLLAAAGALLAPGTNASLLYGVDSLEPLALRLHLMAWLAVGAMGVGYGIASRAPERQTAVIAAGCLGKLALAALLLEMLIAGLGSPLLLLVIGFDGALGLLFAFSLAKTWRRKQNRGDGRVHGVH